MQKVQLFEYKAFRWECPKCKAQNNEEMIPAELTPAELRKLEEENNIDFSKMKGTLFVAPDIVSCEKCKTEYSTIETEDDLDDYISELGDLE